MHYVVIKCPPTALKIPKYTTLTYALYALLMHNPNAPIGNGLPSHVPQDSLYTPVHSLLSYASKALLYSPMTS